MATLQLRPTFMNDYETAHKILQSNPAFNEQKWLQMTRQGDLDMYIDTIYRTNSTLLNTINKEYNLDYSDEDTKFNIIYNELHKDELSKSINKRTRLKAEAQQKLDKGIRVDLNDKDNYETYDVDDYTYFKNALKDKTVRDFEIYNEQMERERIDSISDFTKSLANTAGIFGEAVNGVFKTVDGITSGIYGIGKGITALSWKEAEKAMASDEWRFFEKLGVEDALIDFERRYTHLRDFNGNFTTFGKYAAGIANTMGMMMPAMLGGMGAGAYAKVLGAAASTVATVQKVSSTLIFYGAMTSNSVRDMYQQFAINDVSVPTGSVLANAALKSVAQVGVELLLSRFLGGTAIDNMVFGRGVSATASSSLAKAGWNRLLSDFAHEGLEEVFQDTSDFLLDKAFSALVDENFGEITDMTWESISDAFLIGGLASFAGSALKIWGPKITKSPKFENGEVVVDKKGKTVYARKFSFGERIDSGAVYENKKGELKAEKLSRIASWEYGLDMQSFIENFNTLAEQGEQLIKIYDADSKEGKKYIAAFTEMYAAYRMIASVYHELGETRFNAANQILTSITAMIKSGKFSSSALSMAATSIYDSVIGMEGKSREVTIGKLKDAMITEIADKVYRGEDIRGILSKELTESAEETFKGDKDIHTIVYTKDGKTIVEAEGVLFVPIKYAGKVKGSTLFQTLAEQHLVQAIMQGKFKGQVLDTILETFKKVTGDDTKTLEEAVYNLVFNESFFNIMLCTANKDMLALLSSLQQIEASVVPDKLRNETYKRKIGKVLDKMKQQLFDYYTNIVAFVDTIVLPDIFTEDEKKRILMTAWCKNLYARVIDDTNFKKLSENDWNVLESRINALPIKESEKDILRKNLKSEKKDVRTSAMNKLANAYRGIFTTNYDGKVYMPATNIANNTFNAYLRANGLTIETLVSMDVVDSNIKQVIVDTYGEFNQENLIKFRQAQFMQTCKNKFTFRFSKAGKIGVYEAETNKQVGYAAYKAQQVELTEKGLTDETAVIKATKYNHFVKAIVNELIDPATAAYLSIDDIINDSSLLTDEIQAEIQMEYGDVNAVSTFMYLRKYFINKFGNTTVIVLQDGSYAFGDITAMKEMLINEDFEITDKTKIGDLIRSKYLVGKLADIKIKTTDRAIVAEYNSDENVIYINKKYTAKKDSFLTFSLLHEFQHAIQSQNGQNLGLCDRWIFSKSLSATTRNAIIADVRKHRPELFEGITKGSEEEKQIVNDFVYFSSGESTAYGIDATTLLDFYPTIVSLDNSGSRVHMPWGKSYYLGEFALPISKASQTDLLTEYQSRLEFLDELSQMTTLEEFEDVYNKYNADDPEIQQLAKRVFALCDRLKLQYKVEAFAPRTDGKLYGGDYDPQGIVRLNLDWLRQVIQNNGKNANKYIAQVILHETLHACTTYAIELQNNEYYVSRSSLSDADVAQLNTLRNAGRIILDTYKNIIGNEDFVDIVITETGSKYGLSSPLEFTSELANPRFRAGLKKIKTIWDRILDAFCKLFGLQKGDNAYDNTFKAVDAILDNFNETLYNQYVQYKAEHKKQTYHSELGSEDSAKPIYNKGKSRRVNVSQKEGKGTNLEKYGYTAKYKRTQMDVGLKNFIINANENIDGYLWDELTNGTLTVQHIMDFVRDATNIDNSTFKLINDCFFHNTKIKTFTELQEKISMSPKVYAARAMLKSLGYSEQLLESANEETIEKAIKLFEKAGGNTKKVFDKIVDDYWISSSGKGDTTSEKYLRTLWMRLYDGSLETAGQLAGFAKVAGMSAEIFKQKWTVTGEGTSLQSESMDKEVGDGMSKYDLIADPTAKQDFENILNTVASDMAPETLNIIRKQLKNAYKVGKMSQEEYDKRIRELDKDPYTFTKEEYVRNIARNLYSRLVYHKKYENLSEKAKSSVETVANGFVKKVLKLRPSKAMVNNIKTINRTIKSNLSTKERKRFLEDNSDIFDDKLKVKPELYQTTDKFGKIVLKEPAEISALEKRVKALSKDVQQDVYSSKKALAFKKRLERDIAKLQREKAELAKAGLEGKETVVIKYVNVGEDTLEIESEKNAQSEMPFALQRILEYEFTRKYKSHVQYLMDENTTEERISDNLNNFTEANADYLAALTQQDVDAIIEYVTTHSVVVGSNKADRYRATQIYLLTYILKANKDGNAQFTLTEQQHDILYRYTTAVVVDAAKTLANWKVAMKLLKPVDKTYQTMSKKAGIELTTAEIKDFTTAIKTGNAEEIVAAKRRVYDSVRKRYSGRKVSLLDKVLVFERMHMLSSPGTMIRNKVSNFMVEKGNTIAEFTQGPIARMLSKLFPNKKWFKHRDNQYQIIGTKVDEATKKFIQTNIIDSKLLDVIQNGLSKYDARKFKDSTVSDTDVLQKLITDNIRLQLFNNTNIITDNVVLNKIYGWIFKGLSDDKSINKAVVKYLGKILVEDKVDLSKGLSKDVINHLVEAYTLAAEDYMHKANVFNKIEDAIKNWNKVAYFAYKQFLPFAASSWNWFVEGLNYTPVGLVKGIMQFARLEKTIESLDTKRQHGEHVVSSRFAEYLAKRTIGKGVIGSIGLMIGAALAAFGMAGLDEEDDKLKLRVGDVYVDISDLFGMQGILVGIALLSPFTDEKNKDKNAWKKLYESVVAVADQMFIDSTFNDFFSIMRPGQSLGDVIVEKPFDILDMFIPNAWKLFTAAVAGFAPEIQYSKGLKGRIEKALTRYIPTAAYWWPKQYDPYTGELQFTYDGGMWGNFFIDIANKALPFKISPYNVTEAERIALSLGLRKNSLTGNYEVDNKAIELTAKQKAQLNEFYGKLNKTKLDRFIGNKIKYKVFDMKKNKYIELLYDKMTDEQKKTVIERIMSDNSRIAKAYILTSNNICKYYTTDEEFAELKKLGVSKNVYKKTSKYSGFYFIK